VGFDLPSFWIRVGHASKGDGVVGWLEKLVWKPLQFRSLEGGSSVLNEVHLESRMLETSKIVRE